MQELQPGLRVVFVLRDVEGLSTEQTAEVLELTQVAVKARLWRARLRLRDRLSKYFGVGGHLNIVKSTMAPRQKTGSSRADDQTRWQRTWISKLSNWKCELSPDTESTGRNRTLCRPGAPERLEGREPCSR